MQDLAAVCRACSARKINEHSSGPLIQYTGAEEGGGGEEAALTDLSRSLVHQVPCIAYHCRVFYDKKRVGRELSNMEEIECLINEWNF